MNDHQKFYIPIPTNHTHRIINLNLYVGVDIQSPSWIYVLRLTEAEVDILC
jgi:hypothetical protein